jgi:hypothetical protein
MDKDYLTLKRASASRPSGEWDDNDYDVLADGVVVGHIMKAARPCPWARHDGHHEDRSPNGYKPTREASDGGVCEELAAGVTPRINRAVQKMQPRND